MRELKRTDTTSRRLAHLRVRLLPVAILVAAVHCGERAPALVTPRGGSDGFDAGPPSVPVRSAAERACPANGTLRLQLWDVYAMPRKPNGDPWDTPSGLVRELGCRAASEVVVRELEAAFTGPIGAAGVAIEDRVRSLFVTAVANACSVGLNWLLGRWEGPEIYALLDQAGSPRWRAGVTSQDRWAAHLETTRDGGPAFIEVPCANRAVPTTLTVMDEDVVDDDLMARLDLPLASISPETICGGWALQRPYAGVAVILYRVEVDGIGQDCTGLMPSTFEDIILPYEVVERRSTGSAGSPVSHAP